MFLTARKQIEMLYSDRCTITKKETSEDPVTHRSSHEDATVCSDYPCRLSFSSVQSTNNSGNAAKIVQEAKLFIAPEISVPAGSRIVVIRDGRESKWKCSGLPAQYSTHQEIALEPEKTYA